MAREPDWRIEPQGDRALMIVLGNKVDTALNQRARAIAESLSAARLEGVLDVVPAICSVAVHYRPDAVPRKADELPWRALEQRLAVAIAAVEGRKARPGREMRIAVCYGGDFGPDLDEAAGRTGVTADEIVRLHSDNEHLVYMLGFSPGQPYIGGLHPRLMLPRRATPRLKVARGSIAIAQGMTAIYALDTPGGWNIIGRTPMEMFLPQQDPPCLLRPGDSVRFDPITRTEFARLARR